MKAAKLTNNVVTDLWEVPSLDCYEGVTLIEAPDFVAMGATYDGTTFTNPAPPEDTRTYQEKRATDYPTIKDQLDEIYHNGIVSWKAVIKVTKDKYPKPS